MRRVFRIVTVLLILFLSRDTEAIGDDGARIPQPRQVTKKFGEPVEGLSWSVGTFADVTALDSVWFESRLANLSPRPFLFSEQTTYVTIWPANQADKRQTRELTDVLGLLQDYMVRRTTNRGEAALSFRADVRLIFGRLEPGKYVLRSECQMRGKFAGDATFWETKLQSPEVNVTVHPGDETGVKKVAASPFARVVVGKQLEPEIELTNITKDETLLIPYVGLYETPVVLNAVLFSKIWSPRSGWEWVRMPGAPDHIEATKQYELEPGKSVRLRPVQSCLDGDGVYVYVGYVSYLEQAGGAEFYSAPFVVAGSTGLDSPARE